MEALLKSLKVPDLKSILSQVALATTGKKDELVQRILESPQAVDAAQKAHGPAASDSVKTAVVANKGPLEEENLMPPDEFDWGDDGRVGADETATTSATIEPNGDVLSVPAKVAQSPEPSVSKTKAAAEEAPAASTALGPTAQSASATNSSQAALVPAAAPEPTSADMEQERLKRQKRAERFGVVEPVVRPEKRKKTDQTPTSTTDADQAKISARADKFGPVETQEQTAAKLLDAKQKEEKKMATALQRLDVPLGSKKPATPKKAASPASNKSPTKNPVSSPKPSFAQNPKPVLSVEEEEKRKKRAERFKT